MASGGDGSRRIGEGVRGARDASRRPAVHGVERRYGRARDSRTALAALLALSTLASACSDESVDGSPPASDLPSETPSVPPTAPSTDRTATAGGAAVPVLSGDARIAGEIAHVRGVLGAFTTPRGIRREYVLIEPGLSDAQVVDVAGQLHRLAPDTWYFLMDDDDEFDAMLAALPGTAEGDYDGWPTEYVETHLVARLLQEIEGDGDGGTIRRWRVEGGPTRQRLSTELP